MIRGIFIFLITCLILAGAGFFLKDKLGFDAIENFNVDKRKMINDIIRIMKL